MTQKASTDKPDWVIEAEAKLRVFGDERRKLVSVHERILTSFRCLRHPDHDAEAV